MPREETTTAVPNHPLFDKIYDVLIQSQYDTHTHKNLQKQLFGIYNKEGAKKFTGHFTDCAGRIFTIKDRHPNIENAMNFTAQFVVKVNEANSDSDKLCFFVNKVFDYLFDRTEASDTTVRFRAIQFFNLILNGMGNDAKLDDDLCDKLTVTFIDRMMDRQPVVRSHTVQAMHRLQEPLNPDCKIMKTYYYHLSRDPSVSVRKAILHCLAKNRESLREVIERTRDIDDNVRDLAYVFISKVTLTSMTIATRNKLLDRGLNDRSDKVRKTVKSKLLATWLTDKKVEGDVFKLLRYLFPESYADTAILALNCLFEQSKLSTIITALPINEATKLIEALTAENVIYWRCLINFLTKKVLTEEIEKIIPELSVFCEYIREYVTSKLPNWTDDEDRDVNARETSERFIVVQLFEIAALYDFSDEAGRENLMKLIAEVLVMNNKVMHKELIDVAIGMLEKVVPNVERRQELVVGMINELRFPTNRPAQEPETAARLLSENEIHQLNMQKAKLGLEHVNLDIAKEEATKQRDYQKLASLDEQQLAITRQMNEITSRISQNTEIINDQEEQEVEAMEDSDTLFVFYTILIKMLEAKDIRVLSPMLKDLLKIILEQTELQQQLYEMRLTALALFCHLDKDVAKEQFYSFFQPMLDKNTGDQALMIGMKAIFDMFVVYSLDDFDVNNYDEAPKQHGARARQLYSKSASPEDIAEELNESSDQPAPQLGEKKDILKFLVQLIDNSNPDIRYVVVEGLSKLILYQKIKNPSLLSRYFLLYFNPITEDETKLRQYLTFFFNLYMELVPYARETIEDIFISTMNVVENAPQESPIAEIDPMKLASCMITLIYAKKRTPEALAEYTNDFAYHMVTESLKESSKDKQRALIRCLKYAEINTEDKDSIKDLMEGANDILEMMERVDKRYIKDVRAFIGILNCEETNCEETAPEAESQLEDEAENPPNEEEEENPEDHISDSEEEEDN